MSDKIATPGFETLCIHGGHHSESNRAHLTPIYASSTYTFDNAEQAIAIFKEEEKGYIYSRWGNPTIEEAAEKIALMEAYNLHNHDGNPLKLKAILHSSGMAAITTMLLSNLKAGDKVITHFSLYGGTQELLDKILPNFGISAVVIDFSDANKVEEAIKADSTIRLMYIETPANPTLKCVDIAALSAIGRSTGLVVCCDNTFATPYLQQPFRYDVDFVMHSTTKFLNGHGTAIGGVLIGRDIERMNGAVTKTHRLLGGNSNAFDAFLLNTGLHTLNLRMDRHCSNAMKVAKFLEGHKGVAMVNYPGLPSHPHHHIAAKQMSQFGSLMSFELKGGFDAGIKFINRLRVCISAVSLGTCDTLISHPASTTHTGVPQHKRLEFGITDGLIRLSVGIETIEDIINDLDNAIG